jgi:hypothetical protein
MTEPSPDGAARPPGAAGLCERCAHAERVRSARSTFLRCRLADTDPRYDKYPRLPVLACPGFSPSASSRTS